MTGSPCSFELGVTSVHLPTTGRKVPPPTRPLTCMGGWLRAPGCAGVPVPAGCALGPPSQPGVRRATLTRCRCPSQGVLQRSNHAAWGHALATQISSLAGWSKPTTRELSKGREVAEEAGWLHRHGVTRLLHPVPRKASHPETQSAVPYAISHGIGEEEALLLCWDRGNGLCGA